MATTKSWMRCFTVALPGSAAFTFVTLPREPAFQLRSRRRSSAFCIGEEAVFRNALFQMISQPRRRRSNPRGRQRSRARRERARERESIPQDWPIVSAAFRPKLGPSLEDLVRCECAHARGGLRCLRYIRFDPEYEMQICEFCYQENRADRPRCRCNCPSCHDYDSNWESVESVPAPPTPYKEDWTLPYSWDVWNPSYTGGASSSTDAWEWSLFVPGDQFEPRWTSDNSSVTQEHLGEHLPAGSPCPCDRPCLFINRNVGCKNGDSCRFCHAWHPARVRFDRPSQNTRIRFKSIVQDFKDKGAGPSLLGALAKVRPYARQLLAQEIVPLPTGVVTKSSLADGYHPLSQASLETTECDLSDDRSVTDFEMERFLDSLAS